MTWFNGQINLFLAVCILFTFSVKAQFNIKVGYTGGQINAPELDEIISRYNTDFSTRFGFIEDDLELVKSMHGIELGLRYRYKNVGYELSWNNMSDKNDFFGTWQTGGSFQDKWFYSLTQYALAIETYYGWVGVGTSLGTRTLRIKTDIAGAPRKKRTVLEDTGWVTNFYLTFQFPGDKVAIAFKPYIQMPLGMQDIGPFSFALNQAVDPNYNEIRQIDTRAVVYGLSIVLYNGKQ